MRASCGPTSPDGDGSDSLDLTADVGYRLDEAPPLGHGIACGDALSHRVGEGQFADGPDTDAG